MDRLQVAALASTKFGWITPDMDVIACNQYAHLQVIGLHQPLYRGWTDLLAQLDAQIVVDREQFYQEATGHWRQDLDEGAGWHNFESNADSLRSMQRHNLMIRLYQEGWIRVGLSWRPTLQGTRNIVEFEGARSVLARCEATLHAMAEQLAREPIVTPVRHGVFGTLELDIEQMRAARPEWTARMLETMGGHQPNPEDFGWTAHWNCQPDQVPQAMLRERLRVLLSWTAHVKHKSGGFHMDSDGIINNRRIRVPEPVMDAAISSFQPAIPGPEDITACLEAAGIASQPTPGQVR